MTTRMAVTAASNRLFRISRPVALVAGAVARARAWARKPIRGLGSKIFCHEAVKVTATSEHCGESEEQAQRKYECAREAQPERFFEYFRVLAPISLVLLYLFRAIVTPADWAISSYPCTWVHSEDAILNLTRSIRCELGY